MHHKAIIEELGIQFLASETEASPNVVSHWKGRRIPQSYWPKVIAAAQKKGLFHISADALMGIRPTDGGAA